MLLARTDFEVPKHQGISWFAFPLDQPGVTIRPLREMTGEAVFNEVFLDDAVVRRRGSDRRRRATDGPSPSRRSTSSARGIGAGGGHGGFSEPGAKGGKIGRRAGDAALDPLPGGNITLGFDDIRALCVAQGRSDDPAIRQKLAQLLTYIRFGRWNAIAGKGRGGPRRRAGGRQHRQGRSDAKIMKLSAEIALDILGPAGMLWAPDGPEGGRFAHAFVFSPASSIYGGTDEIQRNIISERTLGLPREPNPDREDSVR